MKSKLLFLFLIQIQIITAQTFTEVTSSLLNEVAYSSIAFADVDNDNDQDLFIIGADLYGINSKLYINDGTGNFSEMMGTPFIEVWEGSVAFADVDGDNDQDILVTGKNSSFIETSKLYINDGLGNFSEMTNTPFEGVARSSIAFADVDSDNDQDVLITGENSSSMESSKLYINDGMGNFSEMMGTTFQNVEAGSVAFADVNGDNAPDILVTGKYDGFESNSKLYVNDGTGNFNEMMGAPFEGIYYSSVAFADVDGDTDQDVLITGESSGGLVSKLYINDGVGNFSEMTGTPFEEVSFSSIAFADVDNDNDQDVLITGADSLLQPITKLYTNDGIVNSSDELTLSFNLAVTSYPNPTESDIVSLNFKSQENSFVNIKVYDFYGHLIIQHKELAVIGKTTFTINIDSLLPGSYIIQVDNSKSKGATKIIVK